jgi:hypothetical protein
MKPLVRPVLAGMNALLLGVAFFASASPVHAHHGFDANGTVRLLDKQCLVIVRMSPSLISALLASESRGWDGTIDENQHERLQALGKRLFLLGDAAKPLEPSAVKVSREVSGDVAFVLTYPAVTEWPFRLEAKFPQQLGPELTGTVKVHAAPASATERQGAQLGTLDLTRPERSLTVHPPKP